MNIRHKASHVLVNGKSGMGKTSFALRYIKGSEHDRVFIYDPEEEFAERLGAVDRVAKTRERFVELAEKNRVVIYDPATTFAGRFDEGFEFFCEMVYELAKILCARGLKTLMVVDELQKYVNHAYASPSFRIILETGRRQMLDTISLSRSPNRLNPGIREEFTEIILFRLDDESSLKFAASVGANVEAVSRLPEHSYLYFNILRGGERIGKLEFSPP